MKKGSQGGHSIGIMQKGVKKLEAKGFLDRQGRPISLAFQVIPNGILKEMMLGCSRQCQAGLSLRRTKRRVRVGIASLEKRKPIALANWARENCFVKRKLRQGFESISDDRKHYLQKACAPVFHKSIFSTEVLIVKSKGV
jgi:hypothetical protein